MGVPTPTTATKPPASSFRPASRCSNSSARPARSPASTPESLTRPRRSRRRGPGPCASCACRTPSRFSTASANRTGARTSYDGTGPGCPRTVLRPV